MRISYSLPTSLQSAVLLWMVWVVLSSLALALALAFDRFASPAMTEFLYPRGQGPLAFFTLLVARFFLAGILLGIAQGFFLRSLLPIRRWVLHTGVTLPLFFVPLFLAFGTLHDNIIFGGGLPPLWQFAFAGIISLFALPMAIAQRVLLRKYFRNANFWILAAYAGSFLAVFLLLYPFAYPSAYTNPFAFGAALGAFPAASTGLCLVSFKPLQSKTLSGA